MTVLIIPYNAFPILWQHFKDRGYEHDHTNKYLPECICLWSDMYMSHHVLDYIINLNHKRIDKIIDLRTLGDF